MLKLKIIKVVLAAFIVVTTGVMVFFLFFPEKGEQADNSIKTEIEKELAKENVKAVMDAPLMEWSNGRLEAKRMIFEEDKRNPLLKYAVYRNFSCELGSGSRKMTITGQTARIDQQRQAGPHPSIELSGDVNCSTAGGWFIKSGLVFFDSNTGLLLSKEPVTFGKAGTLGKAQHLAYDSNAGSILLRGNIEIISKSGNGENSTVKIQCGYLKYDLNVGLLEMWEELEITRGLEYLKTHKIEGLLNPDSMKMKQMEATPYPVLCFKSIAGISKQEPSESRNTAPLKFNGYKVLTSPVLKFFFYEKTGGLKSIVTTKPSKLTIFPISLEQDNPDIFTADKFTYNFAEDSPILTSLKASGDVKIIENIKTKNSNIKRIIKCRKFDSMFSGKDSSLLSASFREKFSLSEETYKAFARQGLYSAESEELKLLGSPIIRHSDGVSAGAYAVYDLKNAKMILKQNVVSKFENKDGKSGGVFSEPDNIYVNAEQLEHLPELNISTYSGSVKIYQTKNRVFCDFLKTEHGTYSFIAEGNVNGILFPAKKPSQTEPDNPVSFTGGKVSILEKEKLIKFENNGHLRRATGEEIRARNIEYYYNEGVSEPKMVKAEGNVIFKKPPYEARAENLYYDYKKDLATLSGEKVLLYHNGKLASKSRELTFSPRSDIIKIKGEPGKRIEAVWQGKKTR